MNRINGKITLQATIGVLTNEQRVKFAILCAKAVYADSTFHKWADAWLNNSDRSARATLREELAAAVDGPDTAMAASVAADDNGVWYIFVMLIAAPSAEAVTWAALEMAKAAMPFDFIKIAEEAVLS